MTSWDTPGARRLELSRRLRKRGIGLAIISNPRHIFYFSGFPSNLDMYLTLMKGQRSTSFLAIGSEGESSLFLGESEVSSPFTQQRADLPETLDEGVFTYPDYDIDLRMVAHAPDVAREMGRWLGKMPGPKPEKVGIEDWNLAVAYRAKVEKRYPDSDLVGVSDLVMDMRRSKGEDELSSLREANKIVDFAFEAARREARPGRSELDLYRTMNDAAFKQYGPYAWVIGDIVSGERSLGVGGLATARKIRKGETVILDLQAASNNYWSDLARTFVAGAPSQKQEQALRTLVRAKDRAAEMLKPGTAAHSICEAVDGILTEEGYGRMIHHVGHGVGLDAQERPWIIRGSRDKVREGDVCVIEPGIYDGELGGIRVEDCYIVTKDGAEKISRFPIAL